MRISAVSRSPAPAFTLCDAAAFDRIVQATACRAATGLLGRLNAHHPGTGDHSVRVAELTTAMWSEAAAWLGPFEPALLGALLHDVGKLFVPREILDADRQLSGPEFAAMQGHSRQGAALLEELGFADAVVAAARDHHERWSGGGYPTGRPASLLSPLSRAVAAADAFSAMIEPHRSYRRARTVTEALAEMDACRGTQFDPMAVDLLHAAIEARSGEACAVPAPEPGMARGMRGFGAAAMPARSTRDALVVM